MALECKFWRKSFRRKKIRNIETLIIQKQNIRLKNFDFSFSIFLFYSVLFIAGFILEKILIFLILKFLKIIKLNEAVKDFVEKNLLEKVTNNFSFEILLILFLVLILAILYTFLFTIFREKIEKKIEKEFKKKCEENYEIVDIKILQKQIKNKREKIFKNNENFIGILSKNFVFIWIGSILVSLFNNYHLSLMRLNEIGELKEKFENLDNIFISHFWIYVFFLIIIVIIQWVFKIFIESNNSQIITELDEIEDFLDKMEKRSRLKI